MAARSGKATAETRQLAVYHGMEVLLDAQSTPAAQVLQLALPMTGEEFQQVGDEQLRLAGQYLA